MRTAAFLIGLMLASPAMADMYQDASNSKTDTAFRFGSGLDPQYAVKTVTTANATSGSPNITVASAAGIEVGDVINITSPSFTAGLVWVTNIAGTTVTMSSNATSSQTGASVTFGADRFQAGKTLFSNVLGAQTGYFGAAAKGKSTWVGKYWSGADYPSLHAVFGVSEYGSQGGMFATRASDSTGGSVIALGTLMVDDGSVLRGSWNNYDQSNLIGSAPGTHIQTESSIYSQWTPVELDPYTQNRVGNTINLRLDCGVESGTPQDCTTPLHVINNGAAYRSGIIFDSTSITAAGGLSPAMELPANYSVDWFVAGAPTAPNGIRGWRLTSSATAAQGKVDLGNAGTLTLTATAPQLKLADPVSSRTAVFGTDNGYNTVVDAVGGGGTQIRVGGVTYIDALDAQTKITNLVLANPTSVGGLPTCNAAARFALIPVVDISGSPTYRGALTGGGATPGLAMCNGTTWEAH